MSLLLARSLRSLIASSAAVLALTVTGCGIGTQAPIGEDSTVSMLRGNVHGGQQAVSHSVVKLYTSGTSSSGYGLGATWVATSTTDGNGNFGFTKTSSGASDGSTTAWHCPSSGDPLVYAIATGGNPTGASTSTADNPALVLAGIIGKCSSVSTGSTLMINEITTAAFATALGQYLAPGTTAGTEVLGTSSTAQGTIGINNAFSVLANDLIDLNSGYALSSNSFAGTGTASGITVTATPEQSKLITIANILAACVNTTATGNTTNCPLLFSGATPPISGAGVSVGGTYPTAVDTLQAALYMAINPANLSASGSNAPATGGACANASANYNSNVACLFGLVGGTGAPYAGSLSSAPSDWTIGVSFTAAGTCAASGSYSAGGFIQGPFKTAVDASGNVWFIGGGASTTGASGVPAQYMSEIGPYGVPLQCLSNPSATVLSAGRGLTIDPTGNVWASFNSSGQTYDVEEFPNGGSALVNWPTSGVSATSYGLGSDGAGNIYFGGISTGGSIYSFAAPGTSTTPTTPTTYLGPLAAGSSGSNNIVNIAFSPAGTAYIVGTTNGSVYSSYTAGDGGVTASITAVASSHSGSNAYTTVTLTTTAQPGFTVGQQVTFSGFSAGATNATTLGLNGLKAYVSTVTSTGFTAIISSATTATSLTSDPETGTATVATLDSVATSTTATPYGLGIDNSGNAYFGGTCCGSATPYRTMRKLVPSTTAGSAGTVTASALYAAGINGVRSLALDGAGNAWMGLEYSNTQSVTPQTAGFAISAINATGSSFISLSPDGTAPATCNATSGYCATNGGFIKDSFGEARDIAVDPSGGVWVMHTGDEGTGDTYIGNNITLVVGAAVPVVTPLSVAAASSKLATKP